MEMILAAVIFLESHYSYNTNFTNTELASLINFNHLLSEWLVSEWFGGFFWVHTYPKRNLESLLGPRIPTA